MKRLFCSYWPFLFLISFFLSFSSSSANDYIGDLSLAVPSINNAENYTINNVIGNGYDSSDTTTGTASLVGINRWVLRRVTNLPDTLGVAIDSIRIMSDRLYIIQDTTENISQDLHVVDLNVDINQDSLQAIGPRLALVTLNVNINQDSLELISNRTYIMDDSLEHISQDLHVVDLNVDVNQDCLEFVGPRLATVTKNVDINQDSLENVSQDLHVVDLNVDINQDTLEFIGPRLATVTKNVDINQDSLEIQGNRQAVILDTVQIISTNLYTLTISTGVIMDTLEFIGNRLATVTKNVDINQDSLEIISNRLYIIEDTTKNISQDLHVVDLNIDINQDSLEIQGNRQVVIQDTVNAIGPRLATVTLNVDINQDSLEFIGPRLATVSNNVNVNQDTLEFIGSRLATTLNNVNTISTNIGAAANTADSTGSLHAKVRDLSNQVTRIETYTINLPTDPADASVIDADITTAEVLLAGKIALAIDTLKVVTEASGTYSYLDTGNEQTVITIPVTVPSILHTVWLDNVNMTQNGTIRLKYQIDGTNARTFATLPCTAAGDDGYNSPTVMVSDTVLVTYQETVDETAARDIPYRYFIETRQ